MVSMADKRTWLDGPNIPGEYDDAGTPGRWPGENLGLPDAQVGLWRAAVRTLLTGVIFPAAMVDADGRGMHDRATGTIVINS